MKMYWVPKTGSFGVEEPVRIQATGRTEAENEARRLGLEPDNLRECAPDEDPPEGWTNEAGMFFWPPAGQFGVSLDLTTNFRVVVRRVDHENADGGRAYRTFEEAIAAISRLEKLQ